MHYFFSTIQYTFVLRFKIKNKKTVTIYFFPTQNTRSKSHVYICINRYSLRFLCVIGVSGRRCKQFNYIKRLIVCYLCWCWRVARNRSFDKDSENWSVDDKSGNIRNVCLTLYNGADIRLSKDKKNISIVCDFLGWNEFLVLNALYNIHFNFLNKQKCFVFKIDVKTVIIT